jgi:cobyrinic acid a,c-diamide synthase
LIWNGREYDMSGALPFDVTMIDKPQGHGYITLDVEGETPYFKAGASVRGHEFHHSRVVNLENDKVRFAFRVTRGYGIDGSHDGVIYKNVLACYTHLHALSSPGWAEKLVAAGENYRARRAH